MLFGFVRRWQRRIIWCLLLVILVLVIKQQYPDLGQQVGQWISGTRDSRVAKAVSSMVESLSDGKDLKTAVEVFCEGMEDSEQN